MEHTYGTLCKTDHKTTKYVLTNLRGLKSYQLLFNHNGMKQKSITKVKQEKKYIEIKECTLDNQLKKKLKGNQKTSI